MRAPCPELHPLPAELTHPNRAVEFGGLGFVAQSVAKVTSTVGVYVLQVTSTVGVYVLQVTSTVGVYVLQVTSTVGVYVLQVISTVGVYVLQVTSTVGVYVLQVTSTVGMYVLQHTQTTFNTISKTFPKTQETHDSLRAMCAAQFSRLVILSTPPRVCCTGKDYGIQCE
ncbi:hypothetical protein RRG08_044075 [Elysia crispata]|uniref:Uncharacterized protein n=1 Tax=Elysia crispata TaxID=231223 RepID=A0AAE1EDV1_9GAST|nr:hypothetical protein RRG08_044075 [Elysia crispata]